MIRCLAAESRELHESDEACACCALRAACLHVEFKACCEGLHLLHQAATSCCSTILQIITWQQRYIQLQQPSSRCWRRLPPQQAVQQVKRLPAAASCRQNIEWLRKTCILLHQIVGIESACAQCLGVPRHFAASDARQSISTSIGHHLPAHLLIQGWFGRECGSDHPALFQDRTHQSTLQRTPTRTG